MTKNMTLPEVKARMLKTRLVALDETHAFIAMYYTLRAAELLHELRLTDQEARDEQGAKAMHLAYRRVREMAEECHAKSHVGIGNIT